MDTDNYQRLDELLHSRIRLAVVSLLVTVEEMDFTLLRDRVGATDGNMNAHLKKLEEAGYIAVKKKFVERKPVTRYRPTLPCLSTASRSRTDSDYIFSVRQDRRRK